VQQRVLPGNARQSACESGPSGPNLNHCIIVLQISIVATDPMRMRHCLCSVVLFVLSVLGGCHAPEEDDSGGPPLTVDLADSKGECAVRGLRMKCDDVPGYLRDTLRVPGDTSIEVRGISPGTSTFAAMSPR
jgi:hypothetical protein